MKIKVLALLTAGLAAGSARAELLPDADAPELTQAAQVIAVGRASHTDGTGPILIAVDSFLKGGGALRQLAVSPDFAGVGKIEERQYGIFFLGRRGKGGAYSAADPYHPALVAAPGQSLAASPDALAGVAGALASVLTAPAATLIDPVKGVQGLVTAAPADQAQYVYYAAAQALATIPYPEAGLALKAIAASDQLPARLWAMYVLFSMDEALDDEEKADYVRSVAPILADPGTLGFSASKLANAIDAHVDSPELIPALTVMLGSNEVAVRRAAASVLSRLAAPEVAAPLAKTALNDSDESVRFYAVRGLALLQDPTTAPTLATFDAKQSELLQQWRSWARARFGS
ncbi:PBS lyase HEAT domain protein repeat-containing protein [Methylocella silvestris BL2]|uniref:PBS lyase HEAT domain protein repeat-containing protein n=1 Tax=Methylocella silvestris (strain DSM 15510 / CIP 108128 / LMG 27833 / NCIMB 13906 / BL2) TaxID=395965 RepID=B8EQ18_METSB|nr:HEAT repeat domain-containing protein [Methylocella silvestris]ACK51508.1 PBS lyase HEAT domain protein repeat-containing protein [Methylocella silvestris BL2]